MVFSVNRRRLLAALPAVVTGLATGTFSKVISAKEVMWEDNPFTLGVASGFPSEQSVVLWTKLHPQEQLPNQAIEIVWQVAFDQHFERMVREGTFVTQADENHTAHVEVVGLSSNTQFFYRFISGAHKSVVGATRTLPAPYSVEKRFSFALASSQHYEHGFFNAYEKMADMKPDLVVFVGDYIHQTPTKLNQKVRSHLGFDECKTLFEYRQRYAQYRGDPSLQRMHQQAPWLVIWNDQEVATGYAGYKDLKRSLIFHKRREMAYQAFWEFMPMPYRLKPKQGSVELYQTITWGRLASFTLLDTRQYRDAPACFDQNKQTTPSFLTKEVCEDLFDNERSMLGLKQEFWLQSQLNDLRARWSFMAQPLCIASMGQAFNQYWSDGWDGYPKARDRLYKALQSAKPSNPIVLSGGLRIAQLSELRYQANKDQNTEVVGLEFSAPSLTSAGWSVERAQQVADANPHIRYVNAQKRGFLFFDVTHERLSVSLFGVEDVKKTSSPAYLIDFFEVNSKELKINRLRRVGS
jgi:alkaline phosphatase D